jgi:hypothetical protein
MTRTRPEILGASFPERDDGNRGVLALDLGDARKVSWMRCRDRQRSGTEARQAKLPIGS